MHLEKRQYLALIVLLTAASLSAAEITLPRYDHVVLIIEENHSLSQVAESPYLASLASRGVFFTRSFAVAHPSQPNYLALFSGSTHGVQDDGHYDLSGPNLALSLASAGLTFVGYSESLPRAGSAVTVPATMFASTTRGPASQPCQTPSTSRSLTFLPETLPLCLSSPSSSPTCATTCTTARYGKAMRGY